MDLNTIANLGVAGFAILVMWWMYDSAAKERERHDKRMMDHEISFRSLQEEIRNKIMSQLNENTRLFEKVVIFPQKSGQG